MDESKNRFLRQLIFFLPLFLGCVGSLFLSILPLKFIPAMSGNSANRFEISIKTDKLPAVAGNSNFLIRANRGSEDIIQELYRQPESRSRVIGFFAEICPSIEIAEIILDSANVNNISPALALALAWEESRLNPLAVNAKNRDGSIDRGLFQLNNRSFPGLDNQSFFDPEINAKYGMSHLRHCLNTGGTEIAALAMYNAGTNRVRNSGTPKTTLDYISRILDNRQEIERRFMERETLFHQELENAAKLTSERQRLVLLMPHASLR